MSTRYFEIDLDAVYRTGGAGALVAISRDVAARLQAGESVLSPSEGEWKPVTLCESPLTPRNPDGSAAAILQPVIRFAAGGWMIVGGGGQWGSDRNRTVLLVESDAVTAREPGRWAKYLHRPVAA